MSKTTLHPERRTGRTTRLADEYVQKFWENPGEWIDVRDHHPTSSMAKYLARIIIKRFSYEHNIDLEVYEDMVTRDITKLRLPAHHAARPWEE